MKIDWRTLIVISIVLLAVSIPFLMANQMGGKGFVFNGFLYNPIDGNSYLAKMVEGARGDWKFTLPYTAESGKGAYIFLFYILLGKIAGLLGITMIMAFHVTRVLCSLYLLIELHRFCKSLFPSDDRLARRSFFLAALFTGMGWLGIIFQRLTPDLITPEAYTFLAAYTNPHFPLSLGLILLTLRNTLLQPAKNWSIWFLLVGFLLANLSPFSIVVTLLIIGCCKVWEWINQRTLEVSNAFLFAISAAPVLIYQLYVVKVDPILGAWNAQNLTPAPAIIDVLIAFLPGLMLAIVGLVFSVKEKITPTSRLLVVWMLLGFILTYLPFSLQRRFLIGLSIPVAILAMIGIGHLKREWMKRLLTMLLYACMLPTLLVVLLLSLSAVAQHNLKMVMLQTESDALDWISTSTRTDAIILASPDIGMFIPAQTGRRVIYGHPFETTHATTRQQEIIDFYSGTWDADKAEEYLVENHIAYIFLGPRERAIGDQAYLQELQVVFSSGDVEILSSGVK
jgi:hypothetical protein